MRLRGWGKDAGCTGEGPACPMDGGSRRQGNQGGKMVGVFTVAGRVQLSGGWRGCTRWIIRTLECVHGGEG